MEGLDELMQGRFDRPVGSTDPTVGPLTLYFLMVAIRWVLMAVPGVHVGLRQFGHVGGP
jgi:hypothetical protein